MHIYGIKILRNLFKKKKKLCKSSGVMCIPFAATKLLSSFQAFRLKKILQQQVHGVCNVFHIFSHKTAEYSKNFTIYMGSL